MIQRSALFCLLTLLSSHIYAQTITNLNSAISTTHINKSSVQKISPIHYTGKDLTLNTINSPTESSYKAIC